MPNRAERRRLMKETPQYQQYRKTTRPYRRAFRGVISRREAERLFLAVARQSALNKAREQETA